MMGVSINARKEIVMGDYMDIAAMSTVMSGAQLQQKTDISVLGLAMDTTKQTGEAVIEIMEAANALVPEIGLGENFDIRV